MAGCRSDPGSSEVPGDIPGVVYHLGESEIMGSRSHGCSTSLEGVAAREAKRGAGPILQRTVPRGEVAQSSQLHAPPLPTAPPFPAPALTPRVEGGAGYPSHLLQAWGHQGPGCIPSITVFDRQLPPSWT